MHYIKGIFYAAISYLIVIHFNHFALHLDSSDVLLSEVLSYIYFPKALFATIIALAIATTTKKINIDNIIISITTSLIIIIVLQTIEVISRFDQIINLISATNTRGTTFKFHLWWFLILLLALLFINFKQHFVKMAFISVLIIGGITVLLSIPINGYRINPVFWIGLQAGGYYCLLPFIWKASQKI